MIDWLLSTVWYGSVLAILISSFALVKPRRWLRLPSRMRAATVLTIAIALLVGNALNSPRKKGVHLVETKMDASLPDYHFREFHSRTIDAPPWKVMAAVKAVTAEEIALFELFTSIRRFGQPGPEGILNAPAEQPILEVATKSGFLLLADEAQEVVIGSLVARPPGFRPNRRIDATWFNELDQPGVVKATMNFIVEGVDANATRLTTETRVFATDDEALRRFTPYWRTIFPGSWILRVTWLNAIAARAEQ
ncbi:MAG TPA: hypothetical protein VNJ02_19080 [Vicinamibacterales bacterium]|nr:hypothetical protein [Vicinamibacterales bacterium]